MALFQGVKVNMKKYMKIKTSTYTSLLLLTLTVLFFGSTGKATLITEDISFLPGNTTYNTTLNVTPLNPSGWGYVDAITYTVSYTFVSYGSAYNSSSSRPQYVYADSKIKGDIVFTDPASNLLLESTPVNHPFSSDTLLATYQTLMFGITNSFSDYQVITDSGIISAFTGSTNVPVNLKATARNVFDVDGNVTIPTSTTLVYGDLLVSYDVVPEPSTWISASMLLFFLGGTAGRSYWRQAKAKG